MFVCHKDHSNSTVDNGLEKNITEGSTIENQEHNRRQHTQKQLARDANIEPKAETYNPQEERRARHLEGKSDYI